MKVFGQNNVYDLFDQFLEKVILADNSFLNDEKNIFNEKSFKEIKDRFVDHYDESDKVFFKKVELQFLNATNSAKLLFAHLNWLWAHAVNDITPSTKKESEKFIKL